jgi:hypothetical protein
LPGHAQLYDVAATSPDNVWASGWGPGPMGELSEALLLHFDGLAWRNVEPPFGAPASGIVGDIAATPEGGVWVVGSVISKASPRGSTFIARC